MKNVKQCPLCGSKKTFVQGSMFKPSRGGLVRYRRCKNCLHNWKTVEIFFTDFLHLTDIYEDDGK